MRFSDNVLDGRRGRDPITGVSIALLKDDGFSDKPGGNPLAWRPKARSRPLI